ncbi:DUF3987 domain-containing protein [Fibrella sp. ES10-3-2-2]|nr:hypothetical protein A6C57_08570 [Fibrella sp. ES10-3-2-2]
MENLTPGISAEEHSISSPTTSDFYQSLPSEFVDQNGYSWVQESEVSSKGYKVFPSGENYTTSSQWKLCTQEDAKRAYNRTKRGLIDGVNAEAVGLKSNKTEKHLSPIKRTNEFDSAVYENLPSPLREAVRILVSIKEKDAFIVSALALVSGVLPNIEGVYNGRQVSPNLYAYILGKYGVGKSTIEFARILVELIHKEKRREHQESEERYKTEKAIYDSDLREFQKNKKSGIPPPEEPIRPKIKMLLIPVNNSKTGLCQLISENEQRAILYETEADSLADALKAEHGSFSDILRKGFHHESISYFRRTNNENVELDSPKLSVLLSSTYDQLLRLIPTAENGLFSRFMFLELVGDDEFENVFDGRKSQYIGQFLAYSQLIKNVYDNLSARDKPVSFDLTKRQKSKFIMIFRAIKQEVRGHVSEDLDGTIHRMGLITFRIAMLLSTLRAFEKGFVGNSIICTDEDFTLSLTIMETLRKNALSIYYGLTKSCQPPTVGSQFDSKPELVAQAVRLREEGKSYTEIAGIMFGKENAQANKSKVYYFLNSRIK